MCIQLFQPVYFILRQQLGIIGIQSQLLGNGPANVFCITCEHDRLGDAGFFESLDSLPAVLFDFIGNMQAAGIGSVIGDVHFGTGCGAGSKVNLVLMKQGFVTGQNLFTTVQDADAVTRSFLIGR